MINISIYKGIIFIEGFEESAKQLSKVEYKKIFSFNSQIQTLDSVKDQLAEQTKLLGGNAVIDFNYGQKTCSWFESWLFFLDDNIKWYGNGSAAIIPEEKAKIIFEKFKKNL